MYVQQYFNWLFAKANSGKFILRIEDTDQNRYDKNSEKSILSSLEWLKLDWDEGPFRQSERKDLYGNIAKKLVDSGWAYYDDTTSEELEELRQLQIREKRLQDTTIEVDTKRLVTNIMKKTKTQNK